MSPFSSERSVFLDSFDGTALHCHVWSATSPKATLFYIHGLQSHSGWLFETGSRLAARGINVVAADRRGSGLSGGERGHSNSGDDILQDYQRAVALARSLDPNLPLLLMGQSFGGSVLAALMCRYRIPVDGLIFSAPALGQQRFRHGAEGLARIREARGGERSAIGLRDGDYTDDLRYRRFMANDMHILRTVTRSMRSSMVELEDIYSERSDPWLPAGLPCYFLEPKIDRIIDLGVSWDILCRNPGVHRLRFDTSAHYLEFSVSRFEVWTMIERIASGDLHRESAA